MSIKLSRMADYAVTLMAVFARAQKAANKASGADLLTVSCLAGQTGLSEATVSQILKKLTRHKLLTSCRGVNGGYSLAMGAETITMAHVVEAMDGPISLTRCLDHENDCCFEGNCMTKKSWQQVNAAVRAALDDLTLKDICS